MTPSSDRERKSMYYVIVHEAERLRRKQRKHEKRDGPKTQRAERLLRVWNEADAQPSSYAPMVPTRLKWWAQSAVERPRPAYLLGFVPQMYYLLVFQSSVQTLAYGPSGPCLDGDHYAMKSASCLSRSGERKTLGSNVRLAMEAMCLRTDVVYGVALASYHSRISWFMGWMFWIQSHAVQFLGVISVIKSGYRNRSGESEGIQVATMVGVY
jgi:hypothetical protein